MRYNYLLFVVIIGIFLTSCEDREPLSWDSEIFLPLLDDRVGWAEYVDDTLISLGEGGEPAMLIINQPIDMISGALAPILPDTSIEENVGIGNIPVAIPVPTEFPFIVQEDEIPIINLGGSGGAYLREVVVSSGEMVFAVESTIGGILEMSYFLTCVTIDGEQVGIDLVIPAAVDGELGVATGSLSLENAVFDLTGASGVESNIITTSFFAIGSMDNEEIFYATNEDNIKVTVQFHDFEVKSALGYFGNLSAGFSADAQIIDTIPLPNPVLDMEGAVAKLKIENTIGADMRFEFESLSFDGQQMVLPTFYGAHDMARAQWIDGSLHQTTYLEIDLAESGSNFYDLIETLPEDLQIIGNIELNPFGDVSLGNDYVDVDESPKLNLQLEIPFRVGIDGVVLEESYVLDPMEFPKFDGHLLVDMWSSFPATVTAELDYVVNDVDGTVISVFAELGPGDLQMNTLGHGFFEIPVNEAILEPGGTINVTISVSTEGAVVFTGEEDVRVQVRVEGTQLIEE